MAMYQTFNIKSLWLLIPQIKHNYKGSGLFK